MAELDLSNTAKALDLYGKEVIKRAKRNLKIKKKIDGKNKVTDNTGKLASSLYYKLTKGKSSINIKFESSTDYGYFMEKGVQGRLSTYGSVKKYPTGMTKAKFKKNNLPGGVVENWIRTKKVKLRDKDGKFIPMTDSNIRGASYVIGKSIAEKGLGARGFMADAIDETKRRFAISLKEGLLKDLRNSIEIK
jgi:hypothetical protein